MSKKTKSRNTDKFCLNLRGIIFNPVTDLKESVELKLDKFIRPFLFRQNGNFNNNVHGNTKMELKIIVGKGNNSAHFIDGKNPLRYFVENYLEKLGLNWKNAGYFDGQEGVILVNLAL